MHPYELELMMRERQRQLSNEVAHARLLADARRGAPRRRSRLLRGLSALLAAFKRATWARPPGDAREPREGAPGGYGVPASPLPRGRSALRERADAERGAEASFHEA